MARPHPFIDKRLAVLPIIAVIAFGCALSEPAADRKPKLIAREPMDPLWPDHLRCLVLGAQAADDRICAALSAVDWER
jgi:hypothetical protein